MGHYDLFSSFYDASTEKHYVEQRSLAIAALDLTPGMSALDLPCGTGQAFDGVAGAVLPGGDLVGVDFSSGVLGKASKRVAKNGGDHTALSEGDARTVSRGDLVAIGAPAQVDRLHTFLGMSAFPGWTAKADITRPLWDPLEAVASAYERRDLPSKPLHCGAICLTTGTKSQ
jgi:SAM-dependent methyltransferase